ncbi:MAG TPA: hypothetical protein VJC03_07940, partial [bacterium]|nr:hypothetical protein [bacterium]
MKVKIPFSCRILLLFCLFIPASSLPGEKRSDLFFEAGEKYTRGDWDGALEVLEEETGDILSDPQSRELLALCLKTAGMHYSGEREYRKALPYFEKFLRYFPADEEMTKLRLYVLENLALP